MIDHTSLSQQQKDFIWNTLEAIHRMPANCNIPLNLQNTTYPATLHAIQYIIQERLDYMCQFSVVFGAPNIDGLSGDGDRWIPGVNYQPTYIQKSRLLKKWEPKICLNQINNLSLSHNNVNHTSKLTETAMAEPKTTRTRKPKAETPVVQATEAYLVPVVSETAIEAAFNHPKKLVEEKLKVLRAFKAITTPEEASKLQAAMIDLNGVLKQVDQVHKTMKAPYLEGERAVDAVKKLIYDGADADVANAKKMLYDYDVVQRQEADKARQQAELQRKEAEQKATNEANAVQSLAQTMDEFEKRVAAEIIDSTNIEQLGLAYTNNLVNFYPVESTHGLLLQDALNMKERLMALGHAKDAVLRADENLQAQKISPAQHADIVSGPFALIQKYSFDYNKGKEALLNSTQAAVEEVKIDAEMTKAEITGQQIMTQPTLHVQVRRKCRFELTDVKQLAQAILDGAINPSFLALNEKAVDEWKKQQNESDNPLQHGEIINGITFYWEEIPVSPRA